MWTAKVKGQTNSELNAFDLIFSEGYPNEPPG